jgi:hypothetical protein
MKERFPFFISFEPVARTCSCREEQTREKPRDAAPSNSPCQRPFGNEIEMMMDGN